MRDAIMAVALLVPVVLSAAGADRTEQQPPRVRERAAAQDEKAAEVLRTYDARWPGRVPLDLTALSIGTWNTMLQPWMPYRSQVVSTIASTNLDVLLLQEVWTAAAKDAIVRNRLVRQKYPYHYYAAALPEAGFCAQFVPTQFLEDYLSCLVQSGIDTSTLAQPLAPVPSDCAFIRLNIELIDPSCRACIDNTAQTLPAGMSPLEAIERCEDNQGARYVHGGQTGLLILSRRPIENVQVLPYDSYEVKRAAILATVGGVRFAFTQFAQNELADISPDLGPFQTGVLQPQMAQDLIATGASVLIGGFNSSPTYQPEAYNLLRAAGYKPLFSQNTHCPGPSHSAFPPCVVEQQQLGAIGPRPLDNIFVMSGGGACLRGDFAEDPVSDHVGLAALCILRRQ